MSEQSAELSQRMHEASGLAQDGRVEEAFEILREEEETHPEDPTLLCMLGVVAGEIPPASALAYEYFRRCLDAQPVDPQVLVPLGLGLARYDDPDAERVLRLAAVTAPQQLSARVEYGTYLAREGLVEEAVAELQAARSLDDADPRVPRGLAIAYLNADRFDEAVRELEIALERVDDDAQLRLMYGLALLKTGEASDAAEEIHRAAMLDVDDGDAQLISALASAEQEWLDEAWDAIARAEGAAFPADSGMVREAEEVIEAGPSEAGEFLREQILPAALRTRLLELD